MKYGFTTGSCAAAAAKAATYMLLSGREKRKVTIETPKNIPFEAVIEDIKREENQVTCAVCKDGGDDPDVTTGTKIYVNVSYQNQNSKIRIEGGFGVGRVTRPGLDQPVGNAAINSIPRQMIETEVEKVRKLFDCQCGLRIEIYVPEGENLAKNTFNPKLGIKGGISILGTSGIVEPMSSQALLDTIYVELRQRRVEGTEIIAISPGNYGLDFMKRTYGFDLDRSVKCSNYIGQTIDMAKELGFQKMLLIGHIGKLIKVSGGIMNTHSQEGDCRMELFAAAAVRAGTNLLVIKKILNSINTENVAQILKQENALTMTMQQIMIKISEHLSFRAGADLMIECMVYSNDIGLLGVTPGANKMLAELLMKESI